ncbi:MAG: hypothetical protein KGS72_05610 [Cyanobacteria bacterium REEB67]|nr:hypothetical protein [Cyanobacteria bacterium REEB67]
MSAKNVSAQNPALAEQAWAFSPANFQKENNGSAGDITAALPAAGYGAGARARMRSTTESDQTAPRPALKNPINPNVSPAVSIAIGETVRPEAPELVHSKTNLVEGKTLRSILPKAAFNGRPAPARETRSNAAASEQSAQPNEFVEQTVLPATSQSLAKSPEIAALAKSSPSEDLLLRADIQAHLNGNFAGAWALAQQQASAAIETGPHPAIRPEQKPGVIGAFIQAKQSESASPSVAVPVAAKQQTIIQPEAPSPPEPIRQTAQSWQPEPVKTIARVQEEAPSAWPQPAVVEVKAPIPIPVPPALIAYTPGAAPEVPAAQVAQVAAPAPVQAMLQTQAAAAVEAKAARPADFDVKSHPLFANLNKEAKSSSDNFNARMDKPAAIEDLSRQVMASDFRINQRPAIDAAAASQASDPFAADNCYQSMEISPDGVVKTTTTLPDLTASKVETRNPDKSSTLALTDHLGRPTVEQHFDRNNHLISQTTSRFDFADAPMAASHRIVKTATQTIETTLDRTGVVVASKVMPYSDLHSGNALS